MVKGFSGAVDVLICLALFLYCSQAIFAQHDTLHLLEPVEVTAFRIDLSDIGKHSDRLDTNDVAQLRSHTLASMLAEQTPLYVRAYGAGTLATLGIRGGSASHTQIMWNGIPIRNPMIGMVDLNLIPASIFDEAAIHYGGHGAAFGSGAVGGLISFSNDVLKKKNEVAAQISAGSWSQRSADIKLNYGFNKLRFSTRLFSRFAENDYKYIPLKGLDAKNQVHHQLKDKGLLQEIAFLINERQKITGRAWYQKSDRQIPPTAVQNNSTAAQQDENFRSSLEWSYIGEQWKWQFKTAWLDEKIDYQDSAILLFTNNRFKTLLAELQTSCRLFSTFDIASGLYVETVEASSDNYSAPKDRNQYAGFASARWLKGDWVIRLQMREELTDQIWSPLLFDISSEWSLLKSLMLKASLSRNYRTPTLNDLYWEPGGNPDLEPERGWTFETGLQFKSRANKMSFSTSLTAYIRKMDQWIMWMPPVKDVSLYWTPINVAEVNSHGLEWRKELSWRWNKLDFSWKTGLDLTWSTFGTDISDFQIKSGDQLFYVPVENLTSQLNLAYRQFIVFYAHHWFGSSPGINEDVKAANIGSAGISFSLKKSKFDSTLLFQVDNVWNVPYRLIERRPMPGTSYELGLRLSLH